MVSTVPADYKPCEPHGLSSGVCVCCSIDPSSVRLLLFVFMRQNFICLCCRMSKKKTIKWPKEKVQKDKQ
jgi:hypothetical protein